MKGTTSLILGALLVAGLSLALACCGTVNPQIEAKPAVTATVTPSAPTTMFTEGPKQDVFSASRAALTDYDPPQDAARAAAEAHAAMPGMEERLRDHFYHENPGAFHFPMTVESLLCCGPGASAETLSDRPRWPTSPSPPFNRISIQCW